MKNLTHVGERGDRGAQVGPRREAEGNVYSTCAAAAYYTPIITILLREVAKIIFILRFFFLLICFIVLSYSHEFLLTQRSRLS